MYAIQIENLYVYYNKLCALENINLKVKHKEFLGIIGSNGGGKTTLLKTIIGLLKPNQGKVLLSSNTRIGYVPQFSTFDQTFPMRVIDVVTMGKIPKKIKLFYKHSKEDLQNAFEIMKKLNIYQYRYKQIGQLSGGQLQKVLIARALFTNPTVLILDEPTANIDINAKTEIYKLLKELKKSYTILLVSHDIDQLYKYIDSVLCVNKTSHYISRDSKIDQQKIEETYGCPVKLFAESEIKHKQYTKI